MQIMAAAAVEIIVSGKWVAGIGREAETIPMKRAATRIAFAIMCGMPVMGRGMRGVCVMFVGVMRVAVMGRAGVCSGREPCQCQS